MICKKASNRVNKKIEERQRERIEKQKYEQCIKFRICPKCGKDLKKVIPARSQFNAFTLRLKCVECDYSYYNDSYYSNF